MVRNSHLAAHPLIRERYPLLSQAILIGASAQLRNMATTGGNLMQRTRCYYFYDGAAHCNKRIPGSGCDAIDGFNRIHAILGASAHCIATHPSDMCVRTRRARRHRQYHWSVRRTRVPVTSFTACRAIRPNSTPICSPGELITSVDLPPSTANLRSMYRKVRDRASYAFALVSVAAALKVENRVIADVRIALGGVAHKPWRASVAEEWLRGKAPSREIFVQAADAELAPASREKETLSK